MFKFQMLRKKNGSLFNILKVYLVSLWEKSQSLNFSKLLGLFSALCESEASSKNSFASYYPTPDPGGKPMKERKGILKSEQSKYCCLLYLGWNHCSMVKHILMEGLRPL
ncbi:hypothetical protein ATANTOWER_009911 [Ataeniobius toweri]|uniref:Uncharacterized protein n=1 Tax=Ataeniobius toweri TaxID=208326 RepID=A0ABU7AG18_9TELE|nr:hypothetical protein [Ataeniobius toweri]